MVSSLLKRIVFGYKASSDSYVTFLKRKGITIGDSIEISFPRDTFIDYLNPHLLSIGSNVSMTGPTTILTHDYSVCVLKNGLVEKYSENSRRQESVIMYFWGGVVLSCLEQRLVIM